MRGTGRKSDRTSPARYEEGAMNTCTPSKSLTGHGHRISLRAAYERAVELSVYVAPDKKRLGIGARLYEALELILKEQGILNLYACIACPEKEDEYLAADSVRFHEKLGFQMVGKFHRCGYKFHRWYHMVWMEKHIGLHGENPPGVKSFGEIGPVIGGILEGN